MRHGIAAAALGIVISLAAIPAAFASGGSGSGVSGGGGSVTTSGGGGGGTATGGGSTTSGGSHEPCVKVNSFSAFGGQSQVSMAATLSASVNLSLCSGGSRTFAVSVSAVDSTGAVAWATSIPWSVASSLPLITTLSTDNLPFAATYQVSLRVVNAETGVTDASATATASTPATRAPSCATLSLSGRQGNIGTENALWVFYTVQNCGGSASFDISISALGANGSVLSAFTTMASSGGTGSAGAWDFDPAPVDAYTVTVTMTDHLTGQLEDTKSISA